MDHDPTLLGAGQTQNKDGPCPREFECKYNSQINCIEKLYCLVAPFTPILCVPHFILDCKHFRAGTTSSCVFVLPPPCECEC